MALFLLSVGLIAFILYFYGIGLWYLGIVPIIFLASFLSYHGMMKSLLSRGSARVNSYSLYIAWIVIMIGCVGVLNFFDMESIKIGLTLIGINLGLRIGSYLIKYKDGQSVFQLGYYLSSLFLLIISSALTTPQNTFIIFTYLRTFTFGVMGFLTYIIGIFAETGAYLKYKLLIFGLGTIILFIINKISNTYLGITISIAILTGLFSRMFSILQHKPLSKDKKTNVSVRRILAGERITEPKKYFNSKAMENIYEFVINTPPRTKRTLETINVLLMFSVIISYLFHRQTFGATNQFLYRAIIALFIGNVLILKKAGYNSIIQNLSIFLVINFAIYVSLFSYFDGNFGSVVLRGIIWNLTSSIAIFITPSFLKSIFNSRDYLYRTIATLMAMAVNILLLLQTKTAGELIFFIILLYLGAQGMILFYAFRYILKLQDKTPTPQLS